MNKSVYFFIAAFVSFFTYAESLQCYACTDCPTVTSEQLITCSAQPTTTTVAPTITTESNTTLPSNTTTPANTTETSTTTSSTTPSTTTTSTTTTPTTTTETLNITNTTTEGLLRVQRSVLHGHKKHYPPAIVDVDRTTSSFYCFTATIRNENNTDVIVRGCGDLSVTNVTVCDLYNSTEIQQCNTCTTDRCNDAHYLQSSMILLLSLFSLVSIRIL